MTDDLAGTGIGLDALADAVATADDDGDVRCDVECSTHGERRLAGDTFSVAILDCMLNITPSK